LKQKNKIFNDPIYGFVHLSNAIDFEIIEHPYFQRLRRISQLGLTYLVYPGAYHTRFHHAIGAYHLMQQAVKTLRTKGVYISKEEGIAVCRAILLHDIGHGPFSHALEHSIVHQISHESISKLLMDYFNRKFDGELDLTIEIFEGKYHRKFLHQLISGQLDMDRLDYLKRDSFYTGVSEGVINSDRILSMLNVVNDELVVESKAIYSIEKFIIARRLMYWQVYLHKAVLSAEFMLEKVLERAKELAMQGTEVFATSSMSYFLKKEVNLSDFESNPEVLDQFCHLDDYDVISGIKEWIRHDDFILSDLSKRILNRNLFKIRLQNDQIKPDFIAQLKKRVLTNYPISESDLKYFILEGKISNLAYNAEKENILLLQKDGKLVDLLNTADQLNMSVLSQTVEKEYVCFPDYI